VIPELAREKMEQKQATRRHYYNQGARGLKSLANGQIHIQAKAGNWNPATVLGQHNTPRSYNVRTKDGSEYRRNRLHLLKSRTAGSPQYTYEKTGGNGDKPENSRTF